MAISRRTQMERDEKAARDSKPIESPWDVEPDTAPEDDSDDEWERMICALPDGPEPYNDGPFCDWETGEVFKTKDWRDNPDNLTDPADCMCSYSRSSHTVFCPTGYNSKELGPNEADPFAGMPKVPYRDRVSEGRNTWYLGP
jgi:hypothetical protein